MGDSTVRFIRDHASYPQTSESLKMAEFLYDRMSRRLKLAAVFAFLAVYLSIIGCIVYAVAHFVFKFW